MSIYTRNKKTKQVRAKKKLKIPKIVREFRENCCLFDFGTKWWDHLDQEYHVPRGNNNETITKKYRGELLSCHHLRTLTYKKILEHLAGTQTHYYSSRHYDSTTKKSSEYIWVLIDIDVLKKLQLGSIQGGRDFAEYLIRHYFPNAYREESTNGKGQHIYLKFYCGDMDNKEVNAHLRTLQDVLRNISHEISADIEEIEIKGTCPVFTWGSENGKWTLINYKGGQLAKIPREMVVRADELRNTTVVTTEMVHNWVNLVPPRPQEVKTAKKSKGSAGGYVFSDDAIGMTKTGGHYRGIAAQIMGGETLNLKHRRVITTEDMAITLMLGLFFSTKGKNENGAMPWLRFKNTWISLFDAGDITRPWDNNRFKACRDLLSDKGYINWEDEVYHPGFQGKDEYYNGKCCKWCFTEDLCEILISLSNQDEREVSLVSTNSKEQEEYQEGEGIRPVKILDLEAFKTFQDKERNKMIQEYERQQEILDKLFYAA